MEGRGRGRGRGGRRGARGARGHTSLLELPEEVVALILRRLDAWSLMRVWDSCRTLRALVTRHGVSGWLRLAHCPLGSPEALKLRFFRELGPTIERLDLSCMPHLYKSTVIPTLRRMKNLKALDITYTNIEFLDLSEICYSNSQLVEISAHLMPNALTRAEVYDELSLSFTKLEYLHIVVDYMTLFDASNPIVVLKRCKRLKELKLTVRKRIYDRDESYFRLPPLPMKMFSFHINYSPSFDNILVEFQNVSVMKQFNLTDWEYILIQHYCTNVEVMMSHKFFEAGQGGSSGRPYLLLPSDTPYFFTGDLSICMWHKDLACNEDFYGRIIREMEKTMPQYICSKTYDKVSCNSLSNSFYISPCTFTNYEWKAALRLQSPRSPKKKKMMVTKTDLNIDSFVKTDKKIKVSFKKLCDCYNITIDEIVLDHKSSIFQNISFLSLDRYLPWLQQKFFDDLFRICKNLETLNLDSPCALGRHKYLCNAIHLSKSIKNIRISDSCIDGDRLFEALSACDTLENVHICDYSGVDNWYNPPSEKTLNTFIQTCKNLFSLQIHCCMPNSVQKRQTRVIMDSLTRLRKKGLHLVIRNFQSDYKYHVRTDPHSRIFYEHDDITQLSINKRLKLY